MKNIFKAYIIIVASLYCLGCTKGNDDEFSGQQGIYGVITDFDTGEPVKTANVQLRPTGETTLTGYDGEYEFQDIPTGAYSITVSKAEYSAVIDDYVIKVLPNKMSRRDLRIEKLLADIQIVDNNLKPLDALDYGTYSNSLQFVIFNKGTVRIDCKVVAGCSWIGFMNTDTYNIPSGGTCPVIVTVNRELLEPGLNTGFVYVNSNNGNYSIKVSAIGKTKLPEVETLPVTYIDGTITPWCNTFHANVIEVGKPAYVERGFCFSSTNTKPTTKDNNVVVSGTGLGKYSYTEWNFPPQTVKYYVRAWLKSSDGEIIYGNVESFVFNDVN